MGFTDGYPKHPVAIVVCVSEKVYHDRHGEPDKLNDEGKEIEWPAPC